MVSRRSRGPLAVFTGLHRVVRQHRDAAHPAVARPIGGGQMIMDLGDDAKEYGRQALRAFEATGGEPLVQQAEAKPARRESLAGPVLSDLGAWGLCDRADADGLYVDDVVWRSAGSWAVP